MADKKSIFLPLGIACLAILLGLYTWARWRGDDKKLLREKDFRSLTRMEYADPKQRVVIAREGDTFKFISPYEGIPVYMEALRSYYSALCELEIGRVISDTGTPLLADFGISESSPVLMLEFSRRRMILAMGDRSPLGNQRYVHMPDRNILFITRRDAAHLFDVRAEKLRDGRIIEYDASDITDISVYTGGRKRYGLVRRHKRWYVSGHGSQRQYLCERAHVEELIKNLANLRVMDFAPYDLQMDTKECGITEPHISLGVGADTISFGRFYGASMVYTAKNNELVGGCPAEFVREIPTSAEPYYLRTVIDFPLHRVARFTATGEEMIYTYEKKRGVWYRTGAKTRRMDERRMYEFFTALASLSVQAHIFDEPLGSIRKEYLMYDRNGIELAHILIGGISQDGHIKVRFGDTQQLVGVLKDSVEALVY